MLSVNRRSHVSGYVIVLQIFGAPKSCAFGGTLKSCSIDSTPRVELKKKKGYIRNHVSCKGSYLTNVKREERQRFLIRTLQESNVVVDWW